MKGYVVAKVVGTLSEAPDNSHVAYWTKDGRWVAIRVPKSTVRRRNLADTVSNWTRPSHLFMRVWDEDLISRDISHIDYPLVTTQWEMAAENAWIDNDKKIIEFRVLNKTPEPLNLAIIMNGKRPAFTPGQSVRLAHNWGFQDGQFILEKGTKGTIYGVNDDGMSFSVATKQGNFSWIRENFLQKTFLGL